MATDTMKKVDSHFNLVVYDEEGPITSALKEVEELVRQIVSHFRRSHQATFRFDESCMESGKKALRFLPDCPTRWTERFTSWMRMLENREKLEDYKTRMRESENVAEKREEKWLTAHFLSDSHWTIIQAMVPILKDFVHVIDTVSASDPTIGLVYPLIKQLRVDTLKGTLTDSALTSAIKMAFRCSLDHYFSVIENPHVAGGVLRLHQRDYHEKVLLLGWLFDPSQFHARIIDGDLLQDVIQHAVDTGERLFPSKEVCNAKDGIFMDINRSGNQLHRLGLPEIGKVTYRQKLMSEFGVNLNMLLSAEETPDGIKKLCNIDVLEWWFAHQHEFPELYRLSRVVLSLPAAATACERFFSVCGLTVSDRRSSLKLSTCRTIWFARTMFKEFTDDELPFLDEYINARKQ
jgi:hypothetical protein